MAETIARYEILDVLGVGGFATVYKAKDPANGEIVAIKKLHSHRISDPGVIQRFRREMRILASLRHEHIVRVLDSGDEEGIPYLVMEYLPKTLTQHIKENTPLRPDDAANIAVQILEALHAADQDNIVHRDLKPDNVMITEDGTIKVTDFGLARVIEPNVEASTRLMGTPNYLSPEQGLGRTPDIRSDIYSVGIMLYEMLTGAPPFSGDTAYVVLRRHIEEEPIPLEEARPDVPEWLSAVVAKALAKRPEDRFQEPMSALSAIRGRDLRLVYRPPKPLPIWMLAFPFIACCLLVVPLVAFFGGADLFNWEVIMATLWAGSATAVLGACLGFVVPRRRVSRILLLLLLLTGILGLIGIAANTGYALAVSAALLIIASLATIRRPSAVWI